MEGDNTTTTITPWSLPRTGELDSTLQLIRRGHIDIAVPSVLRPLSPCLQVALSYPVLSTGTVRYTTIDRSLAMQDGYNNAVRPKISSQ